MPREPIVSVIMSVRNAWPFLPEAVESITAQTLTDFELLITDDGSNDEGAAWMKRLDDPRLRLTVNDRSLGLTVNLNRMLDAARGRYVARMDGDDVSDPARLVRQVEFLKANPAVGIVGTGRHIIDRHGRRLATAANPATDPAIRLKALLGNPFTHPTVMIRRSVLEAHHLRYDPAFITAQDYELWTRLLAVTRGANLPDPLLSYRRHESISAVRRDEQLANHDRIVLQAFAAILPDFAITADQARHLRGRYGGHSVREAEQDPADAAWRALMNRVIDAFGDRYDPSPEAAEAAAAARATLAELTGPPA